MAAGRGKPQISQATNVVIAGVALFLIFIVGIYMSGSPAQPAGVSSEETEAQIEALKAGAQKGSLTVQDEAPVAEEKIATVEADAAASADAGRASDTPSADAEKVTEASSKDDEGSSKEDDESGKEETSESKEEVSTKSESTSAQSEEESDNDSDTSAGSSVEFPLCADAKDDYIPCLDNHKAIAKLKSTAHYEHRERHCPTGEDQKKCLVPLPEGYQPHIKWPESRDQIWYSNVPHPSLANYKADQNWVRAEGDKFIFPGGGTQFKRGATQYIEWLQESCPELKLGDHMVVGLDAGCGVASFAAYLEPFGVRMMSIAPKDEHEAQIQFALERGVSAMVGVMGTMRQPYPANVFDAVHCARCRVPWHKDGGMLLAEVNRIIRPGGYFIWSATPLCLNCKAKEKDDKEVWEAMKKLTKDMCWTMIVKNVNEEWGVAVAVFQKPTDNECYVNRDEDTIPPLCPEDDDADAAWYVKMNACLHKVPLASENKHGSQWPAPGISRKQEMPAWLSSFGKGLYGRPAEVEFPKDTEHWENVVKTYLDERKTPIDWSTVRNIMDMDSHYGSFGAAISRIRAWSMNVIPITRPNTLPVVFDRGLLGVYHDWCEAFNTYPRTYDLLHSDHLLSHIIDINRCDVEHVLVEMDRIVRPTGYIILREDSTKVEKLQERARALHWKQLKAVDNGNEKVIIYQRTMWRPTQTA